MNPEKWVFNLLLPFLFIRFCTSIDTLTPTQFIKDGDVLVSSGETFALGFFGPENSSHRYVGIWYNKISEQTVIWVANRDRPINGTSGVLSLNRDGNLVIYDNTRNSTVWQTNASAVSYLARLLDSGNLVLFQGDRGSGGVVWQSFDQPTNTLLPTMKLGLDRRTGLEWFLTSWKSRDDPGTGEYSYRVELNELPQLILFKGSTRVWRIPSWLKPGRNDEAEATANSILNATYVNNRDQVYAFYTPINASTLLTTFVDELGSLKILTWIGKWVEFYSVPGDQCATYGRCGAYGYCDSTNRQDFECTCLPGYEPRSAEEWYLRDASGGCIKERKALSMCGNGEGFVKVVNAINPDTYKARLLMSLSVHECKDECLRNCSCLAYASEAEGGERANCITWYENLMDVRKSMRTFPRRSGLDLHVRVDAVELAQSMKSRRIKQKKVAVVVASVVLTSLLFIILVCWLQMKKRRRG
ncbi:G-type lectin S-receptor-like serine/threonine-protein kinase RKS1 [Rhododendron vialii]|uniref:G-type lectin S-receptor-like serine/threonine-protein kinase RKS1 n=1 Tax=Rhododendron vialii TaxID=182163 RepID=UPI00265EB062|nr:G-type lectin S-receptor-like serine/threonine-protein kinase RKS1 [Rhododendron vialii]